MSSSAEHVEGGRAIHVEVSNAELVAELEDGRRISVPLSWYPRIEHASKEERQGWELVGGGTGPLGVCRRGRQRRSAAARQAFE